MDIRLIDIQCGFGGATPGVRDIVPVDNVLASMRDLHIERAVVRIEPDKMDTDIVLSNEKLAAACHPHPELIPCPVVQPVCGSDLPSEEEQVDACIRLGARAVVIRPALDGWLPAPWMANRLFLSLQERRIPVLALERHISLEQAADLAGRYPDLPIILAQQGYRSQRIHMALLTAFPNLFLSIGNNYDVHGGIEQICKIQGARRLLFGTGFPQAEPLCAITYLLYSAVSAEEKQMIGAVNFETLACGVRA
jgi:predicted TIM-barrel fold metal-dependent hydrolase